MPKTPYVKPVGEAGSGRVLICGELPGKGELTTHLEDHAVSLDTAVRLFGTVVVSQYVDGLDWVDWETIRQSNNEPQ